MIEKRNTTMCALLTIMLFTPVVGGCSNGGGKVETTPTPEATTVATQAATQEATASA